MSLPLRAVLMFSLLLALPLAFAQPARERIAGIDAQVQRDLAYGNDPLQRVDIYWPAERKPVAVIVMVHGGGWERGDKRSPGVIENKIAHWLPRGFALVSVNYRMLPDTRPDAQVEDVARAVAFAQAQVAQRGGGVSRLVLMGHSAGAHLVALLAAQPAVATRHGVRPWAATVSLDSAAMDVPGIMSRPHLRLYDEAFGSDPAYWARVSPLQSLTTRMPPLLAVCSSSRRLACPHNRALVQKAQQLGGTAQVLAVEMSHAQINRDLGVASDYTSNVDRFIDAALAAR